MARPCEAGLTLTLFITGKEEGNVFIIVDTVRSSSKTKCRTTLFLGTHRVIIIILLPRVSSPEDRSRRSFFFCPVYLRRRANPCVTTCNIIKSLNRVLYNQSGPIHLEERSEVGACVVVCVTHQSPGPALCSVWIAMFG